MRTMNMHCDGHRETGTCLCWDFWPNTRPTFMRTMNVHCDAHRTTGTCLWWDSHFDFRVPTFHTTSPTFMDFGGCVFVLDMASLNFMLTILSFKLILLHGLCPPNQSSPWLKRECNLHFKQLFLQNFLRFFAVQSLASVEHKNMDPPQITQPCPDCS